MSSKNISRREFAKAFSLSIGSLLFFNQCKFSYEPQYRFFSEEEATLTDAIVEQIIPTDEWLGAKGAGVTNFIDKQLVGPFSRFKTDYRSGLNSIIVTCQNIYGKKFEELSWCEQTEFLKEMERGTFSDIESKNTGNNDNFWNDNERVWKKGADRSFFELIRSHTMAGYYGSPRHGGNYMYVSYRMIGLDIPTIQGRNKHNLS